MFLTIVAALPFTLLFILMIIFRKPAFISLPIVLISTIFTTYFIWGMEPLWYGVTFIKGFFVTIDILLIIFGAITLFLVLKYGGVFEHIQNAVERISTDRRVQAILIAWFFVSLIEGAAGFGTPAMLAAPILVHIGFRPLVAVVLTLIGDSVAVTFGAVGVPITIGLTQGLSLEPNILNSLIVDTIATTSIFHLFMGSFIPLIISCMVTYLYSKSIVKGLLIWKFALFSGLCFTLPMYIIAITLGPEFPSILGSLVGMFIILFFAKHKFLLPKESYRFPNDTPVNSNSKKIGFVTFFKSLMPYILLVLLLALTRLQNLPLGQFARSLSIHIDSILNTHISHTFQPLYSPGFLFIVVSLFSLVYYRVPLTNLIPIFKETTQKVSIPFFSLLVALSLVNVLLYSQYNNQQLPGILLYLSREMSYLSFMWPFLAPITGLIGAFVTGSSTVSNLLFATFQYQTAIQFNYSPSLILGLQSVGSAMGNMIAIHNIVVVLSVVGLHHREGHVLRLTIIPAISYIVLVGIVAMIATSFN